MIEDLHKIVHEVSYAGDLQDALGIIVTRVRAALRIDVCSVYLHDPLNHSYVLRATDGLRQEAIGRVRLAENEGLVGLVAERKEPLHLEEAAGHPRYRYFPETGEEEFSAFLGVPIIHYRKVLGVLVAQQRRKRLFERDEAAFLLTIAAQLGGAIHDVSLVGGVSELLRAPPLEVSNVISGSVASKGIAIGTVVVRAHAAHLYAVPNRAAEDAAAEIGQLRTAVAAVQEDMKHLGERMAPILSQAERALFDVYVMLLDSDTLLADMIARIERGAWAPAAVRDTILSHVRVFESAKDEYLASRAVDIEDLGERILRRLYAAQSREDADYPGDCVLVGEEVGIADIADVPRERLRGIVMGRGAPYSHAAILARAIGVPAVVGVGELPLSVMGGHGIIVDGNAGQIVIEPSPGVRNEYEQLLRDEQRLAAELRDLRDLPAVTPDGVQIALHVNTGLVSDISPSVESGAAGVGLFRTEFAFMVREAFPGEDEQFLNYQNVLAAFAPRPVTMRTLDVGGDKPLPYFGAAEDNPALGWRGIRISLDHPEIFLVQIRAMLRANAGYGNLRVMFPMISGPSELDDVMALFERAVQELHDEGQGVIRPPVGAMIEVPAAVYSVARIGSRVDFLSVGSNDLTQYLLAVDRANPRVAQMYDSLHPAVLQAISEALHGARACGKPISLCGDLAGDPCGVVLLLGMGFDSMSMTAASLPRAKRIIRTIPAAAAAEVYADTLACEEPAEVRCRARHALDQAGLKELV